MPGLSLWIVDTCFMTSVFHTGLKRSVGVPCVDTIRNRQKFALCITRAHLDSITYGSGLFSKIWFNRKYFLQIWSISHRLENSFNRTANSSCTCGGQNLIRFLHEQVSVKPTQLKNDVSQEKHGEECEKVFDDFHSVFFVSVKCNHHGWECTTNSHKERLEKNDFESGTEIVDDKSKKKHDRRNPTNDDFENRKFHDFLKQIVLFLFTCTQLYTSR